MTLGSSGAAGSLLELYSFEGSAEGYVTKYAVTKFHPEGPGSYGVQRGGLTRVDFTATAQFLGDSTKPGPAIGMSQVTTRFRLQLDRPTTYIHNQPGQTQTLSPIRPSAGKLVAFAGEPGWNKLLRGEWVEYNTFPLAIS